MMILERFEGDFAILEDVAASKHIEVDIGLLPMGAKEGDVLQKNDSGFYIIDKGETNARRSQIVSRLRKMGL